MASHQRQPVSLMEHVRRGGLLTLSIVKTLLSIPGTMWAVRDDAWPLKRVLAVAFLQNRGSLAKRASNLAVAPTTGESIDAACRKRNIAVSPTIIQCGDSPDATLHEIELDGRGDVLLYFHGGGYRNGIAGEGHVPVVLDCAAAARCSKVIFLEYVLAPGVVYPGQLVQAARAIEVLLNERNLRPSQLILGGDSAGGNLVLALLSHLHQPKPGVPPVQGFQAGDLFKDVFLFSPWVAMSTSAASFRENASKDYLTEETMRMFVDFWKPSEDLWTDFLLAGEDFWAHLPVLRLMVTVGEFEAFRDDVSTTAKRCAAGMGDRVTFEISPGEIHVQAVVDRVLGLPDAASLVAHLEWLRAL